MPSGFKDNLFGNDFQNYIYMEVVNSIKCCQAMYALMYLYM